MTDLEREKVLQTIKYYIENRTRESTKKILIQAGIYDENVFFTEPYELLNLIFTPEGAYAEQEEINI
jgi:hypothetical protein